MGGNFGVESVAVLPWNQWQLSRGISGKFTVEWVATFAWNTQRAASFDDVHAGRIGQAKQVAFLNRMRITGRPD
jgi:hypothetical protein